MTEKELEKIFPRLLRLFEEEEAKSQVNTGYFNHSGTTRYASGRYFDFQFLRNSINKWDTLRIAVVNDEGMGVAVYGRNGFSYTGQTKSSLRNKIDEINRDNGNIVDVSMSSDGGVVIVYDSYGWHSNGAPSSFNNRLHYYNNNKENILSASFNSHNEYCIVTDKHYDTSGGKISEFVKTAQSRFGAIDYAYLTNLGRVAICRRGIYYENIPSSIVEAFGRIKFKPDYIKFTDSGYFCISNKKGAARYCI